MKRRKFVGQLSRATCALALGRAWSGFAGRYAYGAFRAPATVTIACYYYPGWHPDMVRGKMFYPGWMEWELLKQAQPQFVGHQQPKVPAWGYEDESQPEVMQRKIAAAADHGIHAFIFDWYYSNQGPMLQEALEEGFLQADNNQRLKFAVMWSNHDMKADSPGIVQPKTFSDLTRYVIERYFRQPTYWHIGGKPYFSLYLANNFIASLGSVHAARNALHEFRATARKAGLAGVHINGIFYGLTEKPQIAGPADVAPAVSLAAQLGLDSISSYTWVHHVPLRTLKTDYLEMWRGYTAFREEVMQISNVPYYPIVSAGWDNTPKYPSAHILWENTPARFQSAVVEAMSRVSGWSPRNRIVMINAWNEWMEGSYLEPDTVHGMAYLEALRKAQKITSSRRDPPGQAPTGCPPARNGR